MRTGLSTIQQTLTPEAASVLNQSIAEASRRNHGQTTPLHVAATLLSSPSGYLRQACIRSHPNSSHPLQCRALELCFSVALERLPTAQNMSPNVEPPISNALMAALKRAQAHQRRGCPEQQQQPLLAVKVELEQLIISILDDPSVSRVMREASFSSPAVKAAIEQSMNSQPNSSSSLNTAPQIGLGFRPGPQSAPIPSISGRSLYMNPRLQQHQQLQQQGNETQTVGQQRGEEVKKVMDVLSRTKKRNPVLVGDSEPEAVLKEVLRRIEKKEVGDGPLKNVEVISVEKELDSSRLQLLAKIKELCSLIEGKMMSSNAGDGGIILDLGDLKWLVDQPPNMGVPVSGSAPYKGVTEAGRVAVSEMGKILRKFGDRLWMIGTATCETYLRCQVYQSTMENEWDLQAVSIAARAPHLGMFPRLGSNGILSNSFESFSPLKSYQIAAPTISRSVSENSDPSRRLSCCPHCLENYERELAKFVAVQAENCFSSDVKSEPKRQQLPQWLQSAEGTADLPRSKEQDLITRQKTQELQKKWVEMCFQLHPSFHQKASIERINPTPLPMVGFCNPKLLGRQPLQPKLQQTRNNGNELRLNITTECQRSPPSSPVRTDLALGQAKTAESAVDKGHKEPIKDILGCISWESRNKSHEFQSDKPLAAADIDSYKKILKDLVEKVWWQREAASAVAATVTQCKAGNGRRHPSGARGDIWLLFSGPDRIGKKKMASALSELVYGVGSVTICLGSRRDSEQSDLNFRGKTALDRIAEAVRRHPFSVTVLQDIDEADMLVRGSIKRAMERGRLSDSNGREIGLGNVIFILTANRVQDNVKNSSNGPPLNEEKLALLASGGWQLRLTVGGKTGKRVADWAHDEDRAAKQPKEMGSALSFDLNEMADIEDDRLDGSRNSSDLTVDHEVEHGRENSHSLASSSALHELLDLVDDAITFKPVDFGPIQYNVERTITRRFSTILGDKISLEVEQEALKKILGGIWLGHTSLEAWADKVLVPSIQQLKASLPLSMEETLAARLEVDSKSENRTHGDWLPSRVTVMVDGQ